MEDARRAAFAANAEVWEGPPSGWHYTHTGGKYQHVRGLAVGEVSLAGRVAKIIDPFVPPPRWGSLDKVKRSADRLQERASQAGTYGLRVGYHNHDHELRSSIDGRTALEVFADLLDPTVAFEVDL